MNIFDHEESDTWVVDIESDSLDARWNPEIRVYLYGVMNLATGEYTISSDISSVPTSGVLVFHNASFDVAVLRTRGLAVPRFFCTMVASHTLNPGSSDEHSLDSLVPEVKISLRELLTQHGYDMSRVPKGEEYTWYGKGDAKVDSIVENYLIKDLEATRNLYLSLEDQYRRIPSTTLDCMLTINQPYIERILEMSQGISVVVDASIENGLRTANTEALHRTMNTVGPLEQDPREYRKGNGTHGPNCKVKYFNPGSNTQVGLALKELYGWVPVKTTDKGAPCVSAEVLEALDYPLVSDLLEYSKTSKLLSFYDGLKGSSWIRPNYNQCATRTTRLSCSGPNIQQIPARDPVGKQLRKAFKARDGYTLLVGDQSGFQLRILAGYLSYYFEEHRLTECFNRGEDVHQFFADIYGIDRKVAKNCLDYAYTKVLTPKGWVWLHEVKVGDTVMGYNSLAHRQEWTSVVDVVDGGYQSCYTFGVGARTVHSTANHDWETGKEVGSGVKRPYKHTGKVSQKEIHDSAATHKKVLHTAKYDGGAYTPIPYSKYDVDWVQWVISASTEQREAFLQGFFLADGCMSNGTRSITQNGGDILDAVQLCWHLLGGQSSITSHSKPYQGKNSTHHCYNLRLIDRQHTTMLSMEQSDEYLARVGCLVTESGNFVIRDTQSKFITITGNCTFGYLFGAGIPKMTSTANRGNPNPIKEKVIKGALKSLQEKMPALPELKALFVDAATRDGGVFTDWMGTRYTVPELISDDKGVRASGSRKTFNYLIQGMEASIFRYLQNLAAPVVHAAGGRQCLVVHDEVGYEVPIDVADELALQLNAIMSPALGDFTPAIDKSDLEGLRLECEFGKGADWYTAK